MADPEPTSRQRHEAPAGHGLGPNVPDAATAFESAAQERELSLAQEFWIFLRENKKWWLLPILIVLGAVALLAYLAAGTGAAPFIYPML